MVMDFLFGSIDQTLMSQDRFRRLSCELEVLANGFGSPDRIKNILKDHPYIRWVKVSPSISPQTRSDFQYHIKFFKLGSDTPVAETDISSGDIREATDIVYDWHFGE
jgi:hypothetical protein